MNIFRQFFSRLVLKMTMEGFDRNGRTSLDRIAPFIDGGNKRGKIKREIPFIPLPSPSVYTARVEKSRWSKGG